MDITAIGTLISTVGFPIAMALLLFWQNSKIVAANTAATLQLSEAVANLEKSLNKELFLRLILESVFLWLWCLDLDCLPPLLIFLPVPLLL